MLFLIGLLGIVVWIYLANRSARKLKVVKLPRASRRSNHAKGKISWDAYRERDDVNPLLKATLLEMVNGDLQEAERLVGRARFATHGKSEDYYWLKAIKELEKKLEKDANNQSS